MDIQPTSTPPAAPLFPPVVESRPSRAGQTQRTGLPRPDAAPTVTPAANGVPRTAVPTGPAAGTLTVPRQARRIQTDTANFIAMVGDTAMIVAGLCIGFWLRFRSGLIPLRETWWTTGDTSRVSFKDYLRLIVVGALILLASFIYQHLYRAQNLLRFRHVAKIVIQSSIVWLIAYVGLSFALNFQPPISRIYVLLSFVATLGAVLAWRWLFHRALRFRSLAGSLRQRLLFVGWNPEAARLAEIIHADPAQPYDIVGCVPSPSGRYVMNPKRNLRTLGDYQDLPELLRENGADMVVLADLDTKTGEVVGLTNLCERLMIQFKVIPSYFQILVSGLQLETISGVPILGVGELPLDRMHNRILKRTMDIAGAIVGLILGAPLMAWFGWKIKREDPGPVFFSQERVGRQGRPFKMYKLRSMKQGSEKFDHLNQSTLREDPRLLTTGAFMRKWNVDEVPQFWNVLLGHMSLVGPRPERTYHSEQLADQIPHYNARYASKPGITGWAQVNGLRGESDLTERIRYDLFYLENWSLSLDLQVLAMTLISRRNAY